MYSRLKEGLLNFEFFERINEFIKKAKDYPGCLNGDQIRSPCTRFKYQNRKF